MKTAVMRVIWFWFLLVFPLTVYASSQTAFVYDERCSFQSKSNTVYITCCLWYVTFAVFDDFKYFKLCILFVFFLQNLMLYSVSIICQCILMSVFILSVFSCTVLFVSISQVIGCEDRLRSDLYCVQWGVKLYLNQPFIFCRYCFAGPCVGWYFCAHISSCNSLAIRH